MLVAAHSWITDGGSSSACAVAASATSGAVVATANTAAGSGRILMPRALRGRGGVAVWWCTGCNESITRSDTGGSRLPVVQRDPRVHHPRHRPHHGAGGAEHHTGPDQNELPHRDSSG